MFVQYRTINRFRSSLRVFHRSYSNLDKAEVARKLQAGVLLIDVRTPTEFAESGTVELGSNKGKNIPLDRLASALALTPEAFLAQYGFNKPSLSDEIIFTCAAGKRGKVAAQLADTLNYARTYNYVGGVIDWTGKTIRH